MHAGTSDVRIDSLLEISVGVSTMCVYVEASNDLLVETEESVQVIVRPVNPSDVVNQNVTIIITDNDGQSVTITHL